MSLFDFKEDKEGGVSSNIGNVIYPSGGQIPRHTMTMRTRYERSDDRNTEYNPSGTSSTPPVSPHQTVSDINTLSVAGKSVWRCPEAQHCHHHSARSQKVPVEIPHNNQLFHHFPLHHHYHHIPKRSVGKQFQVKVGPVALSCGRLYRAVPGNSCPSRSLLRSFLPPRDGRHRCCCRRGVRQRCRSRRLSSREAS